MYLKQLAKGITAPHNTRWLNLLLRMALGGIFIVSAVLKIPHQSEFIQVVFSYGVLPYGLVELYGTVLPWIELILGLALVLGLFPRLNAGLSALVGDDYGEQTVLMKEMKYYWCYRD
jgi:uncharacterized membrane protein YphA (DoxX/SURF4 family)